MKVYSKTMNIYNVIEDINGLGSPHSPHIGWEEVKNAKSYALTIIDHEANGVAGLSFIHWGAMNIHNNHICRNGSISRANEIFQFENSLSKHVNNPILPTAALEENANCYYGPCPPDQDHTYTVRVYALDFEDVTDYWDVKKPMFWCDFEDIIDGHVIDEGVLTFASQQAKHHEDGSLYHDESTTHGMFYVLNENDQVDNLRVNINALYKDENGTHYLPKKYYLDLESLIKPTSKFATPAIKIKNIKKAKEYAIFIFNSSTSKQWGLITCEFGCLGIKAQSGDWTNIKENDLNKEEKNRFLIKNSFNENTIVPDEYKKLFAKRQYNWNVFKNKKSTVKDKFHWMVIFALDQTVTDRDKAKNIADAYRQIKNKVIAEKVIKFKLK